MTTTKKSKQDYQMELMQELIYDLGRAMYDVASAVSDSKSTEEWFVEFQQKFNKLSNYEKK